MPEEVVPQTTQGAQRLAPAGTQESAPSQETQATPAEGADSATAAGQQADGTPKPEGAGSEPAKKVSAETVEELKTQRARRQEAERIAADRAAEAAYWRGRAEAGQPATATAEEEKEPVLESYPTYDDWDRARIQYWAKKVVAQQQATQQQTARTSTIDQTYSERITKAEEKLVDWHEVVDNAQIPTLPNEVVMAVKESDLGPEIVYHLDTNPADARRLAGLSPWAAVREIGKLEAKLSAAPPKEPLKTSRAPEPIQQTAAGRTDVSADLSTLPTDDYIAKRNAELHGK